MAGGSRVCPHCRRLNAADEEACAHCGKRLPGAAETAVLGSIAEFAEDGVAGTKLMAGICFLLYGASMISDAWRGGGDLWSLPGVMGFSSSTLVRLGSLEGSLMPPEVWRLVSAVFLHGSLLHIVMNMSSLIWLGRELERRLHTARFLVLYVLSGTLGFALSWTWSGVYASSVGASGAIFGLVGAYVAWLLLDRDPAWHRVLISNLIVALALGVLSPRIDHAAHLGGFCSGFLIGVVFFLEPQPRLRDRPLGFLAGLCVVLSIASLVLSARSPAWKPVREREIRAIEEARRGYSDSE